LGANAVSGYNFCYYRPGAIGHLVDPLIVVGYGLDSTQRGSAYTAVYEITASSAGVVTALSAAKVKAGALVINPVYLARLCGPTEVSSPMIIAEASDFVCLCGSSPWELQYVGNAGQPTLGIAMQSSVWKTIRVYQAHRYVTSDTLYYIPGKGPATQALNIDGNYAQTTMTMSFYGDTYDTVSNYTEALVVATQAVYGSWNLYFAEEVRCQINGVTGKMPKKTVDLRSIKANPASTTFYLYATLTNGVFDYLITSTQQLATRTMIPIGTVVTTGTQIGTVDVQKNLQHRRLLPVAGHRSLCDTNVSWSTVQYVDRD
jgi:hypothetical protein